VLGFPFSALTHSGAQTGLSIGGESFGSPPVRLASPDAHWFCGGASLVFDPVPEFVSRGAGEA
jgi:hypothetical protein